MLFAGMSCGEAVQQPGAWFDLSAGFSPSLGAGYRRDLREAGLSNDLGSTVDGRWRLRLSRTTSDALVVLSGATEYVVERFPSEATLSFDAVSEAKPGAVHTVRLTLNGEEFDSFELSDGLNVSRRIALPNADGTSTIGVQVSGPIGFVALRNPVVGPARIGTPDQRPWPSAADIVVLMADTFRADNLEVGGGDPELGGELNRFAAEGVSFVEARAPATWTLPSHASIFTGRYPAELGVMGERTPLPAGTVTLARHLRRAGYRTVAVTDGGFVSSNFGMDQGFEWFEEHGEFREADFSSTELSFKRLLERDDGRPLFLFVQSYRAHSWVVDTVTRERLRETYEFQPDEVFRSLEWRKSLLELLRTAPHGEPMNGPEYERVVQAMIPNYRGASADAARGFGRLLEHLRTRGTLNSSIVAFTSDHGEAFGSHGVVSHGNGVWDGQARVPLVISCADWPSGIDSRVASPLDLPRTLCSLAGTAPHVEWGGVDLGVSEVESRDQFIFQTLSAKQRYAAVIHEGWKWIFIDDAGPQELAFAYELANDREEQHDQAQRLRGSQGERTARELLVALYTATPQTGDATLSSEDARRIRALGYGSGDDDER